LQNSKHRYHTWLWNQFFLLAFIIAVTTGYAEVSTSLSTQANFQSLNLNQLQFQLGDFAIRAMSGEEETAVIEADGMVLETRQTPITDKSGQVTGVIGIAFDITDLKRTEAALVAQKQLFENLVAIARATSERPTLEATLQNALDVAAELTGAELGSLFLLNEKGEVIHSILARGRAQPAEKDTIVNRVMDRGLAGWVVRHQQPVLIEDTQHDERWLAASSGAYQPRSALSVPILNRSMTIGVLTLTHPEPGRFQEEDLNLIQAAAVISLRALKSKSRSTYTRSSMPSK